MTKRWLAALALVVFAVAVAGAAEPAVTKGKITAIDANKVTIELVGDKADWVKKGAPVKFEGGVGKIVEVTDTTLTFNSKKASVLKVGDEIELKKGPATLQGC